MKTHFLTILVVSLAIAPAVGAGQGNGASDAKQPLALEDVLAWKSIANATVSNDGQWFAYRLGPTEGNAEIVVRSTVDDTVHRFAAGERPRPSGPPAPASARPSRTLSFSDDSAWVAFTIYPTQEASRRAAKQREPRRNGVGVVNLESGEQVEFEDVRSFSFSGELSTWIALHKYAARPASTKGTETDGESQRGEDDDDEPTRGADLLLYELATGSTLNVGNVSAFAFNKGGQWLTWVVDATGQAGNGVQLRNMTSGAVTSLDSDAASYRSLTWTKAGDALAVLKGVEDEDYEDLLYSVLGFSRFTQSGLQTVRYDPSEDSQFPPEMSISPNRPPRWTEDLGGILFGIHEVERKEPGAAEDPDTDDPAGDDDPDDDGESDDPDTEPGKGRRATDEDDLEPADLVIWHWLDQRLQPQQQVQENRDKNFSYLSVYRVAEKRFIRLADEKVRDVTAGPNDRFAVGIDVQPYELTGNLDGRRYRDVYVTDLGTGDRTLAKEKLRWYYGSNPEADHFLYYEDGHFHTYEMTTGQTYNITSGLPASFIDIESDVNVVDPPVGPVGWSADGRWVLLYDDWDVWKVPAHGGGTNLTRNGKRDGIRYNRVFRLDPDDEGIDLSDPVYINAYAEWTKRAGLARLDPDTGELERLLWDDAAFASLMKAKDAETYLYTRQTHTDFPDYYAAEGDLRHGRRLTDANPQQNEFLWSPGSKLIDYESAKGDRLQAAFHLPAGYTEGQRYPTIVLIYEKRSQGLNRYSQPVANGFNPALYTSNGYAVLEPDITYRVNDPGMSAVWCVLPALDAAIATGVVDAARVGLHGHSWGGYQTAMLVTQTDMFAAAAAGAPLTNMISMYSSVYWNTGSANQAIFESSQGRFAGGYWDNPEAYIRNSPVYHAENVSTPLLILHNDKDGAVDWNQGIEYFNTLRRLDKPVVMLQYTGENHGLRKPANRKDYTIRMREFFDHHLRDEPAPDWLAKGIPHLELDDHLEDRAKQIRDASLDK